MKVERSVGLLVSLKPHCAQVARCLILCVYKFIICLFACAIHDLERPIRPIITDSSIKQMKQ